MIVLNCFFEADEPINQETGNPVSRKNPLGLFLTFLQLSVANVYFQSLQDIIVRMYSDV